MFLLFPKNSHKTVHFFSFRWSWPKRSSVSFSHSCLPVRSPWRTAGLPGYSSVAPSRLRKESGWKIRNRLSGWRLITSSAPLAPCSVIHKVTVDLGSALYFLKQGGGYACKPPLKKKTNISGCDRLVSCFKNIFGWSKGAKRRSHMLLTKKVLTLSK